jgi:HNH endonuclease
MVSNWQTVPQSKWEPRFWRRVDKNGPIPEHRPDLGQCWIWSGTLGYGGYGQFRIGRQVLRTHRVAYLLAHGRLPLSRLDVRHLCDNPACVRASHIEEGTVRANAEDKVFRKHSKLSAMNRQRWDEQSLYTSESRVSLWIRQKDGSGKWRYRCVNTQGEAASLPGPFYLRYRKATRRQTMTGKIPTLFDVQVAASKLAL